MRLCVLVCVLLGACAPSVDGEYRACATVADCAPGHACVASASAGAGAPRRCRAACRVDEDCGPQAQCDGAGFCELACHRATLGERGACPAGLACAFAADWASVGVCVGPPRQP